MFLTAQKKKLRIRLYRFTTTLLFSASFFIVLSYFIASAENIFGENTPPNSSLLPSLPKQGAIKKFASALNIEKPITNSTSSQQIPNNISANVQRIRDIFNATASDVRSEIKTIVSDTRNALLQIGITFGEIGSIAVALVAASALIRRPWLRLDKVYSPVIRRIELGAYDIDDSRIPFNLRTFKISYKINTVLVRNKGWKAAKNCKGILRIGNDEVKVYWYAFLPSEIQGMTINSRSVEYLDLFAISDGEVSEVFNSLSENISKLKSYVNNDPSLRQALSARVDAIFNKYKSMEDIPQIITQYPNDSWRIPTEEQCHQTAREAEASTSILVKGNIPIERIKEMTKVIVTSENASRLQKRITILDRSSDARGAAIKF
jgi:hypothetical protein